MELRNQARAGWPQSGSQTRNVSVPLRHEGIGNALRAAYLPRTCELPHDLAVLLAKLA